MVNARGSLGRLDLFYSQVPNRRGGVAEYDFWREIAR